MTLSSYLIMNRTTLAIITLMLVSLYEVSGSQDKLRKTRHPQYIPQGEIDPSKKERAALNAEIEQVKNNVCHLDGIPVEEVVWEGMPEQLEISFPGVDEPVKFNTIDFLQCRAVYELEKYFGAHKFETVFEKIREESSPDSFLKMLELNSFWHRSRWPCHAPLMLNPEWDFENQAVEKWVPNPDDEPMYRERLAELKTQTDEFLGQFFESNGMKLGDMTTQKFIAEMIKVAVYLQAEGAHRLLARILVKQGSKLSPFEIKTRQLFRKDD